jgi:hypothetical protein
MKGLLFVLNLKLLISIIGPSLTTGEIWKRFYIINQNEYYNCIKLEVKLTQAHCVQLDYLFSLIFFHFGP